MTEINNDNNEGQKEESKQDVKPVEEETKQQEGAAGPGTDGDDSSGAGEEGVTAYTTPAAPAAEMLPLDWTQLGVSASDAMPLRYPSDVAEISKEEDLEIIIVGTAGQKITVINKDFSTKDCHPQLEQLVLRSHLIRKMQGLENLKHLELLELYDNQVEELEGLEGCGQNLRVLDMSYNVIRDMLPVKFCQNVQELCKFK